MKIGFIDNFDSFVYNLVRYVRETTAGEVCIQRNNEINFNELDSCDAILLSPGPGIPEEELTKIFEPFEQSSRTKTKAGGTGLGLSICKQIIEMHGGSIWAKNNTSGGATLYFIIPNEQN
jgi:signal transduction histidine kinase